MSSAIFQHHQALPDVHHLVPVTPAQPSRVTEVLRGTADGVPIALRHFEPRVPPRGAVLIAPAMGVQQRFYQRLASWLAARGFHVITFDYRGMGASRRGSLRAERADVITWAEKDASAALAALRERAGALPITWIGHSLGGQIIPFVDGHEQLAKIVTIAAGSGYWRINAAPTRRKVLFLWWGLVPLLTPLFGYFPGRRLGLVGDLPRGVIRQWRAWCLDPDYAAGVVPGARARYESVSTPMTALSFSDDEMMSDASIRSLHDFYRGTAPRMLRLSPANAGVARIGHFGFFRGGMETHWRNHLLPEIVVATAHRQIPKYRQ